MNLGPTRLDPDPTAATTLVGAREEPRQMVNGALEIQSSSAPAAIVGVHLPCASS
jgi:hypothetical protein